MDSDPTRLASAKQTLRQNVLSRRAALASEARDSASARIGRAALNHPALVAADSVFIFVSTGEEVATHALIDTLQARGTQVLVPLLADRRTMLAVPFPGWPAMMPRELGILSPPRDCPPWNGPVDLVLTPGVAFDRSGQRLGYGAGYYDHWLARHPARCVVALAFALQVVDAVPHGPHDRPVEAIITENETIDCSRERPPGGTLG